MVDAITFWIRENEKNIVAIKKLREELCYVKKENERLLLKIKELNENKKIVGDTITKENSKNNIVRKNLINIILKLIQDNEDTVKTLRETQIKFLEFIWNKAS